MTRRSSLRAAAREIYGALAQGQAATPVQTASTPLPNPPPHCSPDGERPLAYGGRDQAAAKDGEGETTSLTARVRALYEDSSVPVAKIAALAGVTERTIYRYVIKPNWKRRYACAARDDAVARANRGRRWQRADGFAAVKGAGGRFIRRDDAAKPFAQGLKATDPAGAARAVAACDAAMRLAGVAQARALQRAHTEARLRAIDAANHALADYARFRQETAREIAKGSAKESAKERAKESAKIQARQGAQAPFAARAGEPYMAPFLEPSKEPAKELSQQPLKARGGRPPPMHDMIERAYISVVEAALRRWQALLAQDEADRARTPGPGAL